MKQSFQLSSLWTKRGEEEIKADENGRRMFEIQEQVKVFNFTKCHRVSPEYRGNDEY